VDAGQEHMAPFAGAARSVRDPLGSSPRTLRRPCGRRCRVRWRQDEGCRLAAEASFTRRMRIRPMPRPSSWAATTSRAFLRVCRPRTPLPRSPRRPHPPRSAPPGDPGRGGPWPGGVCAATSTPCGSSPGPAPAPGHRRVFGWSPTRSRGTIGSRAAARKIVPH
jgi:hypothetical protein